MIDLNFFSTLNRDRCSIMLKEHETFFIYNRFLQKLGNNNITEKNINKIISECLSDFYTNSNSRYFSKRDIPQISSSISKKILRSIIKEEIGRGREGGFDQISGNHIIRKNSDVYVEKGVDTFGEKEIMYIEDDEGNNRVAKVDSPDHASVVVSQMKIKSITKHNV